MRIIKQTQNIFLFKRIAYLGFCANEGIIAITPLFTSADLLKQHRGKSKSVVYRKGVAQRHVAKNIHTGRQINN